jgi:hypothetical protein
METQHDLKKLYQAILYKKVIRSTNEPQAMVVSLPHFFNTYLKKLAYESNLQDRVIQRFFGHWSTQQFTPLKELLTKHLKNDDVFQILLDDLEQLGVPRSTASRIINPTQIELLRAAAFGKVHIVDNEVLRDFLRHLLVTRGNLKADIVNQLLDADALSTFREAVTHLSLGEKNYEVWETLGDGFIKGGLRFYLARRFPNVLTDSRSSSKLTNAGKNYESKAWLPKLFDILQLEPIASYRYEVIHLHPNLANNKKHGDYMLNYINQSMKEDIIESLFGVIHYIIDERIQMGMGNGVCYNILSSLYDEFDLTLDENELQDPITKIKEIMEFSPPRIVGSQSSERMDTTNLIDANQPLEKGVGEYYGLVRYNLWLRFVPGGLLKKQISQPVTIQISSDFKPTAQLAKRDATIKAVDKLKEEYNLTWEKLTGKD